MLAVVGRGVKRVGVCSGGGLTWFFLPPDSFAQKRDYSAQLSGRTVGL